MKKVFFSSLMILTVVFAFANNGNAEPRDVQPVLTNEVAVEQPQKTDDGSCKITLSDGTVVECSDCDCLKLATDLIILDRTI